MKKFIQQRRLTILTLLLFAFISCDNDDGDDSIIINDENNTLNIVETAQDTEALSSLVAALAKADEKEGTDLIGTLSGTGPFTVFAPTNDAFAALLGSLEGFDSLEDFDTDEEKELLATILTYHVVSGAAALSGSLSDGQSITTVQGEAVTISLIDGVFVQDPTGTGAEVVIADVEANNGVVHVIDKVLIPQAVLDALSGEMESNTLVDIVVATEPLSILRDAVIKADLVETLSSAGPFTVFAPTNDAFVALLGVLGDDYNSLDDFDTEAEIALLRDILLYHVIPAQVLAADLSALEVETALADNNLEIIASGETFVIGDASDTNANITGTDIMASNGVAHTIDKVLLPQSAIDFVIQISQKNIVGLAQSVDDLSLLVDALIQADAGLVDVLSGDGPFTVFAPTNAAFSDLLDALGDDFNSLADFDTAEEKGLLAKVLTFHVVAGAKVASGDLVQNQEIPTVQGEALVAQVNPEVRIFDKTGEASNVIGADNEASNGIVHIIDKVLLPREVLDALAPPTPTIVGLAQSVDNLSLLVDALIQADAGLVEVLNGDGPFTVFAPTNAAFAALLNDLGNDYNSLADFDTAEEKALLATILTYHVSAGAAVASGDLMDNQEIPTVQGEALVAVISHEVRVFDKTGVGAEVISADNLASNGIVHIIDKVVLPQAVLDVLNP